MRSPLHSRTPLRPNPLLPDNLMRFYVPVDGPIEPIDKPMTIAQIEAKLGASCLDTVNLRDSNGRVMFVDDNGHAKGLPVNREATRYYLSICWPGTTHEIRGPVIVVPDRDFGGGEP